MKKLLLLALALTVIQLRASAQCSNWTPFNVTEAVYTNIIYGIATSPEADKLDRPYVYVASVAGGVRIFHRDGMGSLTPFATIPTPAFDSLFAINLYQDSNLLYVVLGDIWDTTQMAGLAIVDVSDLFSLDVTDVYVHPGQLGGAGAVIVRDDIAYLAANQNGLVVLNVADKYNIQLKSELPFQNNFPHTQIGNQLMYNARGIDLKDNHAFICYDRGGLRVVDISDPDNPSQVSQYCHPNLIDHATAYNNIVIQDTLAYVAIDYYGMEVLNISDPLNVTQTSWWHPANWADSTNNPVVWATSNGHANEIAYDPDCQKVYIAAGKTDAMAIDVSDPTSPVSCDSIGTVTDDYGTWGLDFYNHELYIAYIWTPPGFPPFSNYTGLLIAGTNCMLGSEEKSTSAFTISPNPMNRGELLHFSATNGTISILTALGEVVYSGTIESSELNLPFTTSGIYFVMIQQENGQMYTQKLIVQ